MTPIRLMVVEDERIIAMDLQQQLEQLGYDVCAVVASGAHAIQSANEQHPDLILMDIHLEGPMDGIDAALAIHQQLKIPIIFLTAYAEDATLQRARAALPYGYLVKPVSPKELHATVQMAKERHVAQQHFEINAERYRQALEAALLDVWEWDARSEKLNVYNVAGSNYHSLFASVYESLDVFYRRIDPRDLGQVKQQLEQTQQHGGSFTVTFRSSNPDNMRWIEAHAKRFDDCRQQPEKIIGVLQDITERRKTEERLRQAMVVFDATAEGILILDPQRKIISINPAFTRLTGYNLADIQTWPNSDALYAQKHSAEFYQTLLGTSHGQWQGNVRYLTKHDRILSAWETINVVLDLDQQVVNYIAVFTDISAILEIQQQLDYLAKHDSLTDLCNRRMFLDRLEVEIAKCSRNHNHLALLLIDLDHFKTINDSLGHAVGDQLLQETARRLTGSVRETDTVARLGGDEFTIILTDLDNIADVDHVAQEILRRLTEPFKLENDICYITGSIGIAIAPADGSEILALIKNADQAMYCAKQSGRNNYQFFEPAMQKASEVRLKISSSLHQAISQRQFWVAYQPIIDLRSGQIRKAEALIRWQHPQHGAMSPAAFIPIAEETGVIQQISDFVFAEVLHQLQAWRQHHQPQLQISINLSPLQFRDPRYLQQWIDRLPALGLPGSALAIEITEGLLLDAGPTVIQTLQQCHQAGIEVSLDDFGTGYSSLSYLKKLDIDYLKIDRSFIESLTAQSDEYALCEAIIVMAHKLGLCVVAEGLETAQQVQLLTDAGCDYGQGYHFARPVAAEAFLQLLMTNVAQMCE